MRPRGSTGIEPRLPRARYLVTPRCSGAARMHTQKGQESLKPDGVVRRKCMLHKPDRCSSCRSVKAMHSSPSQHNPRAHSRACARSQRVGTFRRRVAACAGFVLGEYNTSACPLGSSKIVLEAACAAAARVLYGTTTINVVNDDYYCPTGCTRGLRGIFFNTHPTGRTSDNYRPICAGAPLLNVLYA